MSTLSQFFGSGGRIREIPISSSQSWTPPSWAIGKYATVHAIGPGGSGAFSTTTTHRVTGGSPGGHVPKRIRLANTSYTIVIGAGGARVTATGNGNNGGSATTFSGDGHSLSAAAGLGGVQAATGTATGPSGGSGSGGDTVYTGGKAGDCSNNNGAVTGGASVGWESNGKDSGDANASNAITGGAGLGGPSPTLASGTPTANGRERGGVGIVGFQQGKYFGEGSDGIHESSGVALSQPAGVGAGTGGVRGAAGSRSADASFGAGSGGCIAATAGNSGAGGNGFVLIEVEA